MTEFILVNTEFYTPNTDAFSHNVSGTLGTRGFSRVRREFSVLTEGQHILGRRPKPRAAKLFARVTIKT